MKAKVIFKREGRVKLLLVDGRVLFLSAPVVKRLNPAMQWGDTGTLVVDHVRRRWRFQIDVTDVLPIEIPRDIITPSSKEYENARTRYNTNYRLNQPY